MRVAKKAREHIPGLLLKTLFNRFLNGICSAFYIASDAANRIGARSQCEGTENNSNRDKAGQFHSGLSDKDVVTAQTNGHTCLYRASIPSAHPGPRLCQLAMKPFHPAVIEEI